MGYAVYIFALNTWKRKGHKMRAYHVTKKLGEAKTPINFTVNNWPETLEEKIAAWGEQVTNRLADGGAVIKCRADFVGLTTATKDKPAMNVKEATKKMLSWIPVYTKEAADPLTKLEKEFSAVVDKLSPDAINDLIAKLEAAKSK